MDRIARVDPTRGAGDRAATGAVLNLLSDAALFRGFLSATTSAPDFVLDRGHMFGTELPDADKRALIEFLKMF